MKLDAADNVTRLLRSDDLLASARRPLEPACAFGRMIGQSAGMRAVFETIEQIADTSADVLILGESGTGKELVARCVHQQSRGRDYRFVPVDCGGIPEDLLESELFGHERGAFVGATSRSLGLLEFASRGTLFLDEVGHLPLTLQDKLLQALREDRIRRVGATDEIEIDVRVIAATSLDLHEEIPMGRLQSDLYERIDVVRIELPPLRERREDIPLLVNHFIARHASETGREDVEIDPAVLEMLAAYHWPGNVRELQNVVKRMLMNNRRITADELPGEIVQAADVRSESDPAGFFDLRARHLSFFEKQHLTSLLRAHGGDVSLAAATACVPRATFYRLLKKHGIHPAEFRG